MLEHLRTLSNLDKHRTLTTIASAIAFEGVGLPDGVEVEWGKYGTNQPLGSGATGVSTFIATSESEIAEMNVEPFFSYEVRVEGRSVSVLKGIVHEIYRVLVEGETGKPPSPFATYPL